MQFASMHAERMPPSRTVEVGVSFRGRNVCAQRSAGFHLCGDVPLLGGGVTTPFRVVLRDGYTSTQTELDDACDWLWSRPTGSCARVYVCVLA